MLLIYCSPIIFPLLWKQGISCPGESMISYNVVIICIILLCYLPTFNTAKYSMGCECGMRKLNKQDELDCEQSAKLEDSQV